MDVVIVVVVVIVILAVLVGLAVYVALWHSDPARRADALRVMYLVTALIRALLRMP